MVNRYKNILNLEDLEKFTLNQEDIKDKILLEIKLIWEKAR